MSFSGRVTRRRNPSRLTSNPAGASAISTLKVQFGPNSTCHILGQDYLAAGYGRISPLRRDSVCWADFRLARRHAARTPRRPVEEVPQPKRKAVKTNMGRSLP